MWDLQSNDGSERLSRGILLGRDITCLFAVALRVLCKDQILSCGGNRIHDCKIDYLMIKILLAIFIKINSEYTDSLKLSA